MRVLIIDDEAQFADAVRRGLEAEHFAVDVSHDGADGLWRARENDYDAVILDVMLPGLNGFRVCRRLRDDGNWVPILMLTAKDGDLDHAEALDTGADDFLTKPVSYVVLVARLRALLRRGRQPRPAILEAGTLRLDPAGHRCWRGDTEVELAPRPFAVLEYLMRRAGEVVSKAEIVDHVWDDAFEGDPNVVEVYVGNLRRRIDEPFARSSIETVRGAGYRLAADGG